MDCLGKVRPVSRGRIAPARGPAKDETLDRIAFGLDQELTRPNHDLL